MSQSSPHSTASETTVLTVSLSPAFKLVFLSVLGLTILSLLIGCTLVGLTIRTARNMTPQENVMLDLCTSTFKLGFGAIIGLLGGKAL
jgi:uncharacterized membrane protein (Fun14 family)